MFRPGFRPLSRLTPLTLVLLAACGQGPKPAADTGMEGLPRPWKDPARPVARRLDAGTLQAQAVTSAAFSDLPWTSATSAWGPVERDRSNGEQRAGDGRPLTVAGAHFAKGLGVHANSELEYTLDGHCSAFTVQVGVDDEVGSLGSVVFQLWNGQTKLFDSGVRRGGQAALPVSVDLSGVQMLRLIVTDAGDGMDYDHADWGDPRLTCQAPTPVTFTFQPLAAQPYGVSEAQGAAVGGQIYTVSGFDVTRGLDPLRGFTPTDRVQRYDPASQTWTRLSPFPNGGVTHAGVTSDGTALYYACGYVPDPSGTGQIYGSRRAYRYDPATDSYARLPDLPADCAAGQLEYLDGQLHYFGGLDTSRTVDSAAHYVLDLTRAGAGWTLAAPMPAPRNHLGSATVGHFIYAIGGQTGNESALTTHADVYRYDPGLDRWETMHALPFARGHIANSTFVMDGRVVVVGGETAHVQPTSDVSAYDPATDRWSTLTPLPERRSSAVAALVSGNKYVVTGGIDASAAFQTGGWTASGR
jgi:N-acetylneuraminic acid mutarotase